MLKLNKTEIKRRVKDIIESKKGVFLYINWKKDNVHFLTDTRQRKTEHLSFIR